MLDQCQTCCLSLLNTFSDRGATRALHPYHICGAWLGIRTYPVALYQGLAAPSPQSGTSSPNRHFSVVARQALKVLRIHAQGFRRSATNQRLVPNVSTRHARGAQIQYEIIFGELPLKQVRRPQLPNTRKELFRRPVCFYVEPSMICFRRFY